MVQRAKSPWPVEEILLENSPRVSPDIPPNDYLKDVILRDFFSQRFGDYFGGPFFRETSRIPIP